jgi:hypothetical protein
LRCEATISTSEVEYKRCDGHTKMDICTLDSSIFIEDIFNRVHHRIRTIRRLIQAMG